MGGGSEELHQDDGEVGSNDERSACDFSGQEVSLEVGDVKGVDEDDLRVPYDGCAAGALKLQGEGEEHLHSEAKCSDGAEKEDSAGAFDGLIAGRGEVALDGAHKRHEDSREDGEEHGGDCEVGLTENLARGGVGDACAEGTDHP